MARKIALVHDWLTVPAGSEEVFAEMLDLFPGPVYSSVIDAQRCRFLEGRELNPSFLQGFPLALKKHYLWAPFMPAAYARFDMRAYDLILTSSHSFAHGVRKRPDALHIAYYHTPARALWAPEIDGRGSKTFVHRAISNWLKPKDLEASKGVDYLLANSKTIADRLKMAYGRDVYRVIYPPVHTQRWNEVQRVDDSEGFLYWGRLIDYKRVDLLIEAARLTGDKLQIVGGGPAEANLRSQAQGLTNVTFHGRLSNEDLMGLMGRCRGVLFAAYEDFGIVPVEAMAAGLPVVAFGEGGAAETVTPEFGVQFAEQTAASLAEGMATLKTRSYDATALRQHAAQFDVSCFRQQYHDTVEELWAKHSA